MLYNYIYARISFKTFPKFAGTFYRNSLAKFTGISTVHKEMDIDILRRFKCAVRRKRPRKTEKQELFSLSPQCSRTPVGFD